MAETVQLVDDEAGVQGARASALSGMRPELLAAISVALGGIGQLIVKASLMLSNTVSSAALNADSLKSITGILFGLAIYATGTWFWFRAVGRASISYLYPISASSYILVAMGGRFLFGEGIQPIRWAGIAVITLGVAMLALTHPRGAE
jgi:drug/metabolite transporter (DMT)-like permease